MRNNLLEDGAVAGEAVREAAPTVFATPALAAVDAAAEPQLLTLSAPDEQALRISARNCLDLLTALAPADRPDLRALAGGMALRREHHPHRLAIVAGSIKYFSDKLQAFLDGGRALGMAAGVASPDARAVFVLTGMGPRWESFGRDLFTSEPAFRQAVQQADAALGSHSGWSVLYRINAGPAASPAGLHEMAQKLNFILQIGLIAVWRSWGIEPAAIVGHSVGEVAAAHLSGALSLEDAARIVHHLSRIGPLLPSGGMLAARLTPEIAASLQRDMRGTVTVAAVNSPRSVVLAGAPDALAAVAEKLQSDNIFYRWLAVDLAFHTPHMDRLEAEVFAALDGLRPHTPTITLYSTVTAERVVGPVHDAAYWWDNLRRPVRFAATMDRMIDDGLRMFLEGSPRPLLASAMRECMTHRGVSLDILTSLSRGRSDRATMLEALGVLYCRGHQVAWRSLHPDAAARTAPLGPLWRDPGHASQVPDVRSAPPVVIAQDGELERPSHPLLGRRIRGPNPTWEIDLDAAVLARVSGTGATGVFPPAAFVAAAMALGQAVGGGRAGVLIQMMFSKPLPIAAGERRTLRLELSGKTGDLAIYSGVGGEDAEWTLHANARLSGPARLAGSAVLDLDAVRARCSERPQALGLYRAIVAQKRQHNPDWPVRRIWQGRHEILAELVSDPADSTDCDDRGLDASMLQAAFQAVAEILPNEPFEAPCVPVSIEQIVLHAPTTDRLWCHGRLLRRTDLACESDFTLVAEDGRLLAEIRGLRCEFGPGRAQRAAAERIGESLYTAAWQRCDVPVRLGFGMQRSGAARPEPEGFNPERFGIRSENPGHWVILSDGEGVAPALAGHLEAHGATCTRMQCSLRVDGTLDQLSSELDNVRVRGIIYLAEPDVVSGRTNTRCFNACRPVLTLVQWLASRPTDFAERLVIVTAGVHDIDATALRTEHHGMPSQASLWGFGRVVMQEYPQLNCGLVDLGEGDDSPAQLMLARDLLSEVGEQEVAYRGAARFVHRLQWTNLADARQPAQVMPTTIPLVLQVPQSGVLRKICFRETNARAPGSGEVELRIQSIGLNFKDVLKMMGWLPASVQEDTFFGAGLGMEAAATVTRVGCGVSALRAGDEIVAMPRGGCLQSYTTLPLDQLFWVPRLKGSPWLQQAGMPVIFVTAYYGLHELARLQPGEKVLLHCATGGVGLAAIQVARCLGAEIFATAGSPDKRTYLHQLGIRHVMDSRSLAFADEVMAITRGRGVDVVLNFLSGEALEKSVSVLAPFGRFIELGKRDMEENNALPLRAFNRSLTFSAVDLDRLAILQPETLRRVLRTVWRGAEQGQFQPVHTKVYPIGQVADASRIMLKAKHIGKIVLQMHDQTVPALPARGAAPRCQGDATYLVSGLTGELESEIIRWLVREGARNVVLVKSGPGESRETLFQDTRVFTATCDISNIQEVVSLIDRIDETMPPLRGVVHGALTQGGKSLSSLDQPSFATAANPLVAGAWHLHLATQTADLDFLVTLSSAAGLLGTPGQATRAATNAFLDALSRRRLALGLPATSLCLSELADAGDDGSSTSSAGRQGAAGLSRMEIIEALTLVSGAWPSTIGVMKVNWSRYN